MIRVLRALVVIFLGLTYWLFILWLIIKDVNPLMVTVIAVTGFFLLFLLMLFIIEHPLPFD